MKPLLLNIKHIQAIECRRMANCTLVHGVGIFLNMWRDWQTLPITGYGEYTVESQIENRSRTYAHTLTAHLCEYFELANRRLCFLVTTIDGHRYLIGNHEAPYPLVKTSVSMPRSTTEKSGCTLTVTFTDTIGLLPVLD